MNIAKKILGLVIILIIVQACKVSFSFSGASIHPEAKTYSVQFIENRAPLAPPNLSQYFTDELKDKIQSQTPLDIVTNVGEYDFEGEFTGYRTSPIAIQGNETAAQNRLTITLKIRFVNEFEPKFNFDKSFSHYADYDSNMELSSVEQQLIEEIVEKLLEDVFNEAFVNW